MRMSNLLISGPILKDKAIGYAEELQVEEFHDSNGWFERWKATFNVSFIDSAGEEKAPSHEMTSTWKEVHLPKILSQFELPF